MCHWQERRIFCALLISDFYNEEDPSNVQDDKRFTKHHGLGTKQSRTLQIRSVEHEIASCLAMTWI
ncbi:hypothetical protein FHS10_002819 [Mucilaginibacter dorajii]|nr:hypothetical protein [Mucilaginibacter dorajii]